MDWISNISNMDNTIHDICIKDSCLIIDVKTWDQKIKQIRFSDYYGVKEKNSVGKEIGDILIQTNSALVEELKQDIISGHGTIDEISDVKSIVFYDSWNETILLEILANIISIGFDE